MGDFISDILIGSLESQARQNEFQGKSGAIERAAVRMLERDAARPVYTASVPAVPLTITEKRRRLATRLKAIHVLICLVLVEITAVAIFVNDPKTLMTLSILTIAVLCITGFLLTLGKPNLTVFSIMRNFTIYIVGGSLFCSALVVIIAATVFGG